VNTDHEMLGSNVNDADEYGLQPILDSYDNQTNLADSHVLLEDNESPSTLLDRISGDVPLNKKQRLVAQKILTEALTWLMITQNVPKC
jgi:hypothetical protein